MNTVALLFSGRAGGGCGAGHGGVTGAHAACGLRALLRSRLPVPPWAALLSCSSLWLARRTDSGCFAAAVGVG